MRLGSNRIRAALCGAALFISATPVLAEPIAPASLVPSLDVYVDWIVGGHATAAVCAAAKSPARNETAWTDAKAVFVATLWANGFPIDFVRTVTQRLDVPPAASKPDCTSQLAYATYGGADHDGWLKTLGYALSGLNLAVIAQPVAPEKWAAIKAAINKEIPLEGRLLDCVAVADPEVMPMAVHDWDDMIVQIGTKLAAAGLPRDEISAALSAAEANSIWHRAALADEAKLRDNCMHDLDWQTQFAQFDNLGLGVTITKLLPPPAPASSD